MTNEKFRSEAYDQLERRWEVVSSEARIWPFLVMDLQRHLEAYATATPALRSPKERSGVNSVQRAPQNEMVEMESLDVDEEPQATEFGATEDVPDSFLIELKEEIMPRLEAVLEEVRKTGGVKDRGVFNFAIETDGKPFVEKMRPMRPEAKVTAEKLLAETLPQGRVTLVEKTDGRDLCVQNLVFPPKPDGTLRPAIDMRRLNDMTVPDVSHVDVGAGGN